MTHFRQGWSLAHAFQPVANQEMDLFISESTCGACGRADAAMVDMGGTYNLGFLLYKEVLKKCECGFENRIFLIINDIKRASTKGVISTKDALSKAEGKGLLPDPHLDEGFAQTMLAYHLGDVLRVLDLSEALVNLAPKNANGWYNLGWCYSQWGRWLEALAAFERTRLLETDFDDAWFNECRVLRRLGRYDRADLAWQQFIALKPDAELANVTEVVQRKGQHGMVRLVQDDAVLRMTIDNFDQGMLYLNPPAGRFVPGCDGPGPFSASFAYNGLLLAGLAYPQGKGLVLGLGTGAAVLGLLHQFPQLVLEVVEPETVGLETALEFVPLLAHFRQQGRLKIVAGDTIAYLETTSSTYDFAILDMPGHQRLPDTAYTFFLSTLKKRCGTLWLSLVGSLDEAHLEDVLHSMADNDFPAAFLTASVAPYSWPRLKANWLVSTTAPGQEAMTNFVPHDGLAGEAKSTLQGHLRMILHWHMNAQQVANYLENCSLPTFD